MTVTRQGPPKPYTIRPATPRTAIAGKAYSQTFTVSGTAPYTFTETGTLPAGITFAKGILSGTPTITGNFPFTITATDAKNFTFSQSYILTVNAPTIIVRPTTLRAATAGKSYSQTFSASGGAAVYTFTENGALPAGVTFAKGILSGTPTVAGSFTVTVTATDANHFTGSQSYALTVNAPTIIVRPAILRAATAGKHYSQTFTASGGATPYTFTENGALPVGLTFVKGILSGTPTVAGSFSITVTATDTNHFTGSQSYTITVNAPIITIGPATLHAATVGKHYSQAFTASGGVTPYTFTENGALPAGMTFSKGNLSGIPTVAGSFTITIIVTDANGFSYSLTYNLNVLP